MNDQLSYGNAIAELENIVAKMQRDDCDIDNLAGYTSRALELLKYCKEKLFTTDQEVKKCLEALSSKPE
ncbi:exodeoxyribonuclease VII small subunit [Lepagella muris]|jgi:exodeoxyribonuclease VII small subunit|uniref:Exodeoxyribonuclease VII small subunit n=1 Tax=Lepagella muris TaxID=3032870 RepID=A0AC61RGC8_9BACT|nr:exodeoxyribonuclease VII small subunit [Lepagella muris]ROT03322.1 exodeoxyribonuclease VII small subunit [Muribaculaceae bacterium Isolate-037 (Harlan)]TGY78609.1 exodeoxyribonuclease VII small subunit [Lepagella muris]THG52063.1 exodeoxyribonuclease VII small subunit [Bacteroidales bacterium]TKC54472.1 exodeoxyribonuclease VII small subunit [Bacteroidales bacterium]